VTLSAAIRTARTRCGLSQAQLAAAAGIGETTVEGLENPRPCRRCTGAQVGTLQRIADALEMSLSELLKEVRIDG